MRMERRFSAFTLGQLGFSLIELMVAMVLGLIIVTGAASVYLASKRSLTEVEQVAAISENGRFALQLMGYSVRHIGFLGGAAAQDVRGDDSLGSVSGDCSGDAEAYDTANAFFAVRATAASLLTCITDAVPNTDVLVIKGVGPSPLYDADPDDSSADRDGSISFPSGLDNEVTYLIANSERGILVDRNGTSPDVREGQEFALAVAWPYNLQVYYVRNGDVPTLSRKVLQWDSTAGAMALNTQDLVQGVENMRFLFGYDSTNNGEADSVGNLTTVTNADAWDSVTSMQTFILLRNDVDDPSYENDKTYQLGDISIVPGDNARRILVQGEITLRNPRLILRGGA